MLPFMLCDIPEAGCDEVGRGCLCGPVCAAAVILPPDFRSDEITDSKALSAKRREALRPLIEKEALAWGVAFVSPEEIDRINILNASILAMHLAIDVLTRRSGITPEHILVDGNRFKPYRDIPHHTVVKGDAKYLNIAAASILAKTHRDELMLRLAQECPGYGWEKNMGYPTKDHREAIARLGLSPYHRRSFGPCRDVILNVEC